MGGGLVLGKRQMLSGLCSTQRPFFVDFDELRDLELLQQSPSYDEIDCSVFLDESIVQYVGVTEESEIQ